MGRRLIGLLLVVAAALAMAAPASASSTYASSITSTPGLVGYWRLDEQGSQADAEGMTAADATGLTAGVYHQGVNLGFPGALEGDSDSAIHLGSPDGYVSIPYATALNTPSFTFEGWVEFDRSQNWMVMGGNGAQLSDTSGYLVESFLDGSSSSLALIIGDGSTTHALKGPDYVPGRWYYVAATYDGTTARFYVNGVLVSSGTFPYVPNSANPLLLGTNPVVLGQGQLAGSVDDVAVYSTALSASTIQQHYQLGISGGSPPTTTLQSAPSGVVNQSSATVTFSSNSVQPSYQCQLDEGPWQPCSSPSQLSGLADGSHTFRVRAVNRAGQADPEPPSADWSVDTTPPQTTFVDGPPRVTSSTAASIGFASVYGAVFACSLDGSVPSPCTSPFRASGLADGPHSLSVQATDPAGNAERTPAIYSWSVDTAAPSVFITQAPTTERPDLPFVFVANKAPVTFRCSVDLGPWVPCSSPFYAIQTPGTHGLRIEATDSLGQVTATDATYIWTVRTGAVLRLAVALPRIIRSRAARQAALRSAKSRCRRRVACAAAARAAMVPRLTWSVQAPASLSITIYDRQGRQTGRETLRLSAVHGSMPLPAALLNRLTVPGTYTALLVARTSKATSPFRVLTFVVQR